MASFRDYKTVLVGDLREFPANSRTHSDEQINQIIRSINEFGFTNPLLIDDSNMIIAGHGRLLAAKRIGLESVPCIVVPDLTDAQKAALVIADNKIALNAGWDPAILSAQFDYLRDCNFDLSLTGFDDDEISAFIIPDVQEGLCSGDALPAVVDPVCCVGDVWVLGNHRLLCGDSTNATDVARLLNGQAPNTMVTDPPYGVKYEAGWRAEAEDSKKTARELNSTLANDGEADWYDAYVLFPGCVAYVWHSSAFTDVVMDGLRRAGFDVKQQIIWNKNVQLLSRSDYHWKHEPCWYAVKKGAKRPWKGGRKQVTVWDIASIIFEGDKTGHPTQKPVEVFERSVLHHTNPGEYVYDPFAGSGTLMIACEKTERRALMMELDNKYVDVIIKRYQNYTGKDAIHAESGKTWNQLSQEMMTEVKT